MACSVCPGESNVRSATPRRPLPGLCGQVLYRPMIAAFASVLKLRWKPITAADVSAVTGSASIDTACTVVCGQDVLLAKVVSILETHAFNFHHAFETVVLRLCRTCIYMRRQHDENKPCLDWFQPHDSWSRSGLQTCAADASVEYARGYPGGVWWASNENPGLPATPSNLSILFTVTRYSGDSHAQFEFSHASVDKLD